jgi:hypothetical protein
MTDDGAYYAAILPEVKTAWTGLKFRFLSPARGRG